MSKKKKNSGEGSGAGAGPVFDQMSHQNLEVQLVESRRQTEIVRSYTPIRRNVYLTKKIKKRAEDDGIFCSCSPLKGEPAVCDKDCHCGVLLSTCSENCKCNGSCDNRPFQYRTVKKMKLVKTEKCGSGILAAEDISQGDFVIEYVGEVIDDKACEERLWRMKHSGETNFYLCEVNRDMIIDATYKGNKSRFINHSCKPNTEMQKWTTDGETRIAIFAIRDIKKGEELSYDYQFVQFGADQACYCGSSQCRQMLGSKPNKQRLGYQPSEPKFSPADAACAYKLVLCEIACSSPYMKALLGGQEDHSSRRSDMGKSHPSPCKKKTTSRNCIGEVIRIWCPKDKRYYGGVISAFNPDLGKHTIVTEDSHIELLDLSEENWDFV